MKKLFFTAITLVAFSGISKANTIENQNAVESVEIKKADPCATKAASVMNMVEAEQGCIEDANEYNALYNYYYQLC
jgi:hypothetical protein